MIESVDFDMETDWEPGSGGGMGILSGGRSQAWSEQFRFDLFLRYNEVKQMYELLDEIRSRRAEEKLIFWLENENYLDELGVELWEKAQIALMEVSLDKESLELVAEYTGLLRDTFNLIREIKTTPANLLS